MHRLSDNTAARVNEQGVVFFKWPIEFLTSPEMVELITLWADGLCPVCLEEIPQHDVICDDCLERAQARRQT